MFGQIMIYFILATKIINYKLSLKSILFAPAFAK